MRSVLKESHQSWKFYAGAAVMGCSWALNRWISTNLFVDIATIVLAFGVFAWMCWSIRCPRCSARWLWIAACRPSQQFGGWNARTACSECGWPGEDVQRHVGEADAGAGTSLGSIAAFAGGLGLTFACEPCLIMALAPRRHADDLASVVMIAVGCLFAVGGIASAKRALSEPPSGRRLLGVIGLWSSRIALLVGIPALLLLLTEIGLPHIALHAR